MFRFGAFVLLGSCRGVAVSKPAAIADLQDIARLAVQLADGYATEANAQQSPEGVLEDMQVEDGKAVGAMHTQMLAELSAGEDGPCEATCVRDYEAPCPAGWQLSASGACEAPSAYDGPCPAFGTFSSMVARERRAFEDRCSACWPCAAGVSASAAFLSASSGPTIHLAEPDESLAREIASTAEALSAAFAAVEQRQETTEAMLSSIAASASL